jgi:hypothetical protein
MFFMSGPENGDRRFRRLAVSGGERVRLIRIVHDPVARVTEYTYRFEDGPPGHDLEPVEKVVVAPVTVPVASSECTVMQGMAAFGGSGE